MFSSSVVTKIMEKLPNLNSGGDSCSSCFRILKFTVHMALVVFEVRSLSKQMTNMNHILFGSFWTIAEAPWEKKQGDLSRASTCKRPI